MFRHEKLFHRNLLLRSSIKFKQRFMMNFEEVYIFRKKNKKIADTKKP